MRRRRTGYEQGNTWVTVGPHRIPDPSPAAVAAVHWLIITTADTAESSLRLGCR